MDLYFLRHGDAEPASAATPDQARRLTERGRRETHAVAEALHRAGLRPEAILTSPLARARETGEILGSSILGPRADDLIHLITTLMAYRANVNRIFELPWYHPTLSEVILNIGRDAIGQIAGDADPPPADCGPLGGDTRSE